MRRAIYIGRFQPIHLGHVDVVRHILGAADVDALAVVIGSTQYDHAHKSPEAAWSMNPFALDERREMIERALAGAGLAKPWSVHGVPDTHECASWYRGLVERVPEFTVLYSASRREHELFRARGKEVRAFPRVRSFHAGSIREWLAAGDARYRLAVPPEALEVLDRIGAAERVRAVMAKDAAGAAA